MDIRIFVLLVFVGVLGSLAEARAGFVRYPRNGDVRRDVPPEFAASRSKREVGDSNGETANSSETTVKPTTTTTPATTTTSSTTTDPTTTDPTTTDPTTTDPTTTGPTTTDPTTTVPSTTPTTEPTTTTTTTRTTTTTTTEATTPTTTTATPSTTTPMSTTPATTPTTPTTASPTTAGTTPESTTPTPDSTKPTKKPANDIASRSNFDDPEDSPMKPGSSSKNDAAPSPGPYFGPGAFGPYFGPGFGSGFDPYFGYPEPNFIPDSSPNYGWPNSGSGVASAGASAGSYAGGYSGMGYPSSGYLSSGYPSSGYLSAGYPSAGFPTSGFPAAGSSSVVSRGGFQDNSPDQTGYNPNAIDPLYNAGFAFPGQFPGFNDPAFDMFKQIQAQIEAQHQALADSMASQRHAFMTDQGRRSNRRNYSYSYVSGNTEDLGRRPTFDDSFYPGVGVSNMEFHNRLASEAANYGGTPQVASASIGLGPKGGFQAGHISPAAPGIESRFAEDLPPPSGNSFGVFASSSSSSHTGPDGKQVNHKSSVTGVNDNGKISYRTVHD
ncbi:PREDICTED: uncharacterized protein PB18E9.04c-like isoform X1 [Dinoponera quadriceps]|uniref:Uncharacterized protein PB18E9.04c-like isoform X1 n=1 Tax=Dinoponera quadriceps TaxID=609295 RepID=A0A6P3XUC8_DINQU|nr:PREDICTED: uncharacterized protein PB18E9.04c-like isoform X1 [Dinoponera quadriceps]XP_014482107.1 PREDICTED: uncharacterized protein PB18E9.04c-like isoform X1 [Dinoponera quadriceps]